MSVQGLPHTGTDLCRSAGGALPSFRISREAEYNSRTPLASPVSFWALLFEAVTQTSYELLVITATIFKVNNPVPPAVQALLLAGPQNGCGGYLTNSAYSFGSPVSNVTRRYEKNLDCVWIITAPVNKLINLTFTSFLLEAQSAQACRYDYVKLYDGDNENANLVGTFCGSTVPAPFLSTRNSLTVKFITDNSVEREGFNATYTTVDRLCGGIYNATSTSLTATSPNFPNEYPPFTLCTWVIDAPPQQQVRVVVEAFHLHSGQDCSQNYLQLQDSPTIRNGSDAQSPLLGRFCGNTLPNPIFPQNHVVYLRFKSDFSGAHDGYEITWTSSSSGKAVITK
ncbi:hypothetical protein llap_20266 [Limosa lapponica baueri]|uniref:CUB domain-containing protein n=1 Tax=Limosa lapponica baueri TaxID=1758121 RepID=A0A2I0T6L5_LIMLA|nr:hypothetical protein llap_20266 [Limosa lapponica baueri]